MKIYEVYHRYDVDGDFGVVYKDDVLVAVFQSKEQAEAFADKFSSDRVYDTSVSFGDNLHCGELWVNESDVITEAEFDLNAFDPEDFWWRPEAEAKRIENCLVNDYRYFSEIPVDESGCITQDFCACTKYYDAGTPRDKILADFKKTCAEISYQMSDIEALAAQRGR